MFILELGMFASLHNKSHCEATFYPSTLGSMKWIYLKIHMLPVKEKMQSVFIDVMLHLKSKSNSSLPMHHLQFRIDKYIFQVQTL
jgi:hypothetical protein